MRRLIALAALCAAPALAQSPAAASGVASDSAIRAMIQSRVDGGWNAGIVVGVIDPDGHRRVVAYGPGPNGRPLDGNSVFEIGSITKTFTATLLADMARRGEVTLDEPVAQLLPATVHVPERGGKQITLVDLSTQSSGLPRMPTNFAPRDPANPYADYGADRMYAFLGSYTLPRDIGVQFEYSNLGVGLLGHALALKAGKPYETVLRERVLDPLGMRDTRIQLSDAMRRRLAPGHEPYGAVVPNWDLDALAGAGALRSTVNDMLTYLAANLDSTSRPLGAAMHDAHKARRPAGQMQIGLNWLIGTADGHTVVWHNGGTGGYRTFAGFDEARHIGVVVLSNTSTGVDDIGFHLLDASRPLQTPPKLRTAIVVAPEVLDRYVGDYELTPAFHIVVTRDGAALWGQPSGQDKVQLWPETETDFFIKVVDAQVTFTKDATGAVTGLVLHQNGANLPGKKK
ncbi:MAG: serine hydrolase [Gemmatimonadetes bacterium]|nr:serine hydrolase [Gemmatimonadota bacterium]